MSSTKDANKLSLSRKTRETKPPNDTTNENQDGDDTTNENQDGDDTTTTTSSATQHSMLAAQLKELLSSDNSLINTLADTIAGILLNSSQLINKITENLKTTLIEEVTQSTYQALSMDMEVHKQAREKLLEDQNALATKISAMEAKLDEHEQYSRRNCLLIHGIPEKSKEKTNQIALNTFAEHLELSLTDEDIDRTHRLGQKRVDHTGESNGKSHARPIIVKFISYAKRNAVFKRKSKLKKTGIVITESLTTRRVELLNETKNHDLVKSAWSTDGRIQCITYSDKYINIRNSSDLATL
jgi:predicted nucleotide-binding protein (sugar kinase/HSP70/actin superfamily)